MRIDKWIDLKRTKALCIALAIVFGAEQLAWGMDPATFQLLLGSSEGQRQADAARRASIVTIYDDLYGRLPTTDELKEALEFLNRSPQLAHLVERLAQEIQQRRVGLDERHLFRAVDRQCHYVMLAFPDWHIHG